MTILVCDDDKEIVEAIEIYLMQEGYDVEKAYDGIQAVEIMKNKKIDLMIIDVMMPKLDGIRATLQIRKESRVPIIILSAKTEDADKILGLNVGADDYVTKPFSTKILLKKIAVILRNGDKPEPENFSDGHLWVSLSQGKVMVEQRLCAVTPTEFRILSAFLRANEQQLLTYDMLLDTLWNCGNQIVDRHALAVNIGRLRNKIEDDTHKYIVNVYGMGYQWIGNGS